MSYDYNYQKSAASLNNLVEQAKNGNRDAGYGLRSWDERTTRSGLKYGVDPRYQWPQPPTGGNIAARRSRRVKSKSKTKSKSRRAFRGSRRR